MQRSRIYDLKEWLHSRGRAPLVVRGARQVGKTWLIRNFAALMQKKLLELNFEKQPEWIRCFNSNNPIDILNRLPLYLAGQVHRLIGDPM